MSGRPAGVGSVRRGAPFGSAGPKRCLRSFVRELVASPERASLLARLMRGHEPDEFGWCSHPGHSHHWERHPCTTLLLAQLVEQDGGRDRQEQSPD